MKPTNRILSLDVFRGLTMAMMLIVNNQFGTAFTALRHKPWDGCTPTDLVFPFFLFIVGASMWFSYRKMDHQFSGAAVWRLFKRGASIFLVGLLLNWFPFYDFNAEAWRPWETLRIMNVLQRIGLTFFVGGVLALWLGSYRRILWAVGIILVGYFAAVELLGDNTLEGYAGCRIDAFLLGRNHLLNPRASFDNEGFFSAIPAVATVLLGYCVGKFVGENRAPRNADGGSGSPDSRMKVLGGLAIFGGLALIAALAFNGVCPINKKIWSPTYVLYTAGLASLVWMVLLWFYDYRGRRFGATFASVFGTNALFAYSLVWVLMRILNMPLFRFSVGEQSYTIYTWWASWLASVTTPQWGSLLASLTLIGVMWCIIYPLYRKKIFIRL